MTSDRPMPYGLKLAEPVRWISRGYVDGRKKYVSGNVSFLHYGTIR